MITEDYVSFETAKLLKDKGFDCGCACINHPQCGMSLIGHMINNTALQLTREYELCIDKENFLTIPTIQMVCKWLREEHKIDIEIFVTYKNKMPHYQWRIECLNNQDTIVETPCCSSYEEAVEAALKYVLENLL